MLTFFNVITPIISVINKNKNECYYNIFLEKGSYKDKSNRKNTLNECFYIINEIL